MERILYEGTLFNRISIRALSFPNIQLVRLEVDGELETRLYEWGSLKAPTNKKELKSTLMGILKRACDKEISLGNQSLLEIENHPDYVRLTEFIKTLATEQL